MSTIHVLRHDEHTGPFSEEEIEAQLARGELAPTDLAWREGMANWLPLAEIVVPSADGTRHQKPVRKRVPPAHVMTGLDEFLEVFPDRLVITPKGGTVLQTKGTQNKVRTISYDLLTAIEYKLPGFTNAYLQFTVPAGVDGWSGLLTTPTAENTFRFAKNSANSETAAAIKTYVDERLRTLRTPAPEPGEDAPAKVHTPPAPALLRGDAPPVAPADPAAVWAGVTAGTISLAQEIEKLAALRDRGVLTDEEFRAAKRRLLA